MTMINKKLKKLFAEFERAFGARDFEKIGKFYADTVISADPTGIITLSRAEFLMKARTASEFYRSVGQMSLKIISLDEIPISDHYRLLKSAGERRFARRAIRLLRLMIPTSCKKLSENQKSSRL